MSGLPVSASTPSPRNRQRRKLFIVLTACLVWLAAEVLGWATLWFVDWSRWRDAKQSLISHGPGTTTLATHDPGNIAHPYIGVAYDPETHPGLHDGEFHVPINTLGFPDNDQPLQQRSHDRFLIAIVGGSCAFHLSVQGEATLREHLEDHPLLAGRNVTIINLAAPTFKQPQQVMALNYVMALGAEFDAVLNLDGLNELALARDTADAGVFAAYPRMWMYRVARSTSNALLPEVERLNSLLAQRIELARRACRSPFRRSSLANVWWMFRDRRLGRQLQTVSQHLHDAHQRHGHNYELAGPRQTTPDDETFCRQLADLWRNSSLLLHALCESRGTIYLHALQPNQYVPHSKPMGEEERETAIDDSTVYSKSVRHGYPLLQKRGRELSRQGVRFVDLTRLFEDIDQPIYIDSCCHYNQVGNRLLAERLAQELLAERARNPLQLD